MNTRATTQFGAVALALLLGASSAAAQQSGSQQEQSQASPPSATQKDQKPAVEIDVNSLLGSKVRSKEGRDVGTVDRLMVDAKEGRITTVIISMGGTLGVGARTLAVPWKSVQVARDGKDVIVSLDEKLLQQAPPRAGERQPEPQQPAASPGAGQPPPAQEPQQQQPPQEQPGQSPPAQQPPLRQ